MGVRWAYLFIAPVAALTTGKLGPSDQAQLSQLTAHSGRQRCKPLVPAPKISGRIVGIQIAPALKCTARDGANRHKLFIEEKQATARAILLVSVLKSDEALTRLNHALDDPVKRAAVEQLILALGSLEGGMEQARLQARFPLLLQTRLLPSAEILNRGRAHTQLNEM